ncbi:hypothetical protein [Aminobacter niigataensis]|uniref:hypothetical protein n=1 Tax=Aminobacter niigataensis TaxID=83265 RepID=UPI0024C877BC|nr:hypothetical protein [Aminobacter niigataensis]CAI2932448.1 conserved protein of unknown function [Aminobacter niigataensis]
MLPGFCGMMAGLPTYPAPELITESQLVSTSATHTYSGVSLGGLVVVAIGWTMDSGTARTVSSATIGGQAATVNCQINDAASTAPGVAIISAAVPTPITGDIVINFSGTIHRSSMGAYRVDNYATQTDIATGISGVIAGASGSKTVNLDVAPGGFVIASGLASSFNTTTMTFSAGVTEDYENVTSSIRVNSGSTANLAAQVGRPVTVSGTNSVAGGWGLFIAAASFR